jgi:DeoR/GlpR family transcriptional regulator of sugar metabolism
MRSSVSAEKLAEIAGVEPATIRRLAHDLLELPKQDLEG